jgi:signal transduction histidine kinase
MRHVAETGRQALTDMRRMLGVLNDDGSTAELDPQPGAGDIAELVERFRGTGLPIQLSVTGVPPGDPGMQLTVFRIAQESLTNVLRHAPDASSVSLVIRYGAAEIVIEVDDDGGGPAVPATSGAGRGLLGMRERVALYGGRIESGPRAGGGWRVSARLPIGARTTAGAILTAGATDDDGPTSTEESTE